MFENGRSRDAVPPSIAHASTLMFSLHNFKKITQNETVYGIFHSPLYNCLSCIAVPNNFFSSKYPDENPSFQSHLIYQLKMSKDHLNLLRRSL
jgi:hypothetical protein